MAALNRLTGPTMRTISSQWIDDADTHQILTSFPKTDALLPDIAEAHRGVVDVLEADGGAALDQQIAELRSEGGAIDLRHDRKYRGTYKLLDALAELADDPATATSLLALRDQLHPNGPAQVNTPWAEEAGNAATVRKSLSKETRASLKAVRSTEGRTLDDEVQTWLKAADKLAPLAAQKAAAEHQAKNLRVDGETSAMNAARNQWVKVARALESSLDLVKEITPAQRGAVLGLLYDSAAKAERRSAAQRKGDAEPTDPPDDPATT